LLVLVYFWTLWELLCFQVRSLHLQWFNSVSNGSISWTLSQPRTQSRSLSRKEDIQIKWTFPQPHTWQKEENRKGIWTFRWIQKSNQIQKWDTNVQAIFLHYLGDAISSAMVLGAGLLIHFFRKAKWIAYIDPASSLLIVLLILWTTLPLSKSSDYLLV
jgi:Co/Zn/Cd efflux system component